MHKMYWYSLGRCWVLMGCDLKHSSPKCFKKCSQSAVHSLMDSQFNQKMKRLKHFSNGIITKQKRSVWIVEIYIITKGISPTRNLTCALLSVLLFCKTSLAAKCNTFLRWSSTFHMPHWDTRIFQYNKTLDNGDVKKWFSTEAESWIITTFLLALKGRDSTSGICATT